MSAKEDDPPSRKFSLTGLAICLGLLLATFTAYIPVTRFDFLGLDDHSYVFENTHLHDGFTWAGLKWAFFSYDPDNWFPVTRLSHMLDYAAFGLRAPWHHAVNVLIHALASVMLYAFLRRATRQRWPSAFVAAVFALHPMHVESVAWISERKDVLCAFFWFASLWAWVRYIERPTKSSYALALTLFAAGLMSKPMIVTLPLLLPLLDIWPFRRPFTRRLLLEELPFLALSAAGATLTVLAQSAVGAVRPLAALPLALRVENALVTVFIYIGKTFWPDGLATPYSLPASYPAWLVILAAIGIVGTSALVLTMRQVRPYLATGWFWFLITLVPVIGLVQVGAQARADRYMYVPMVGLLIVVAWGGADILSLIRSRLIRSIIRERLRWVVPVTAVFAGALCISLASAAWTQEQYWQDSPTLFRHAIAVDDQNYLAWEYLGASTDWETELAGRLECFRIAAQIRPDLPEPHGSYGRALLKADLVPESIAEFETSLRISPSDTRTRDNLGTALLRANRVPEAVAQFELAVRYDPDSPMAHNNLAVGLWRTQGGSAEAKKHLEKAIALRPDDYLTYHNLGFVLLEMPDGLAEAVRSFIQALAIHPQDVAAHIGLSKALARPPFTDPEAAEAHMNIARQLEPNPQRRQRYETPGIDYGEPR